MKLAYYPGCSGQGTSAEYERSTRAVCRALEIALKEIPDWSCCGSTPAHACDHVLSAALSARNLALAAKDGAERVGTPCPSCLANLKTAKYRMKDEAFRGKVDALLDEPCPEELPDTVSILQVLVEDYGLEAIAEKVKKPLEGVKIACYYGCLMSRPADIMQFDNAENPMAMDNIMTALGAEVVPFPLKTECCGAAMGVARQDVTGSPPPRHHRPSDGPHPRTGAGLWRGRRGRRLSPVSHEPRPAPASGRGREHENAGPVFHAAHGPGPRPAAAGTRL